jgi:hypothetical protein
MGEWSTPQAKQGGRSKGEPVRCDNDASMSVIVMGGWGG